MPRLVYICGLLWFVASFFTPATPDQMTNSQGEEVEQWDSPGWTQLGLAFEPAFQIAEFSTAVKQPEDHGDGFDVEQARHLRRALYSIPASCGWFSIILSGLMMPWMWIRPSPSRPLRLGLRIAGGMILAAVPLVMGDFYGHATAYPGHFHLGPGAYLIVAAYAFVGTSLLLQAAGPPQTAQPVRPTRSEPRPRGVRRLVAPATIVGALAVCAVVVVPALTGPSARGGNTTALGACGSVTLCFRHVIGERGGRSARAADLDAIEREQFEQLESPYTNWLGAAKILVTTAAVGGGPWGGNQLVAVCDTAFDNVPQRIFRQLPARHAAAYLDGTTALLSVAEFQRLDRSNFVDLRSIWGGDRGPVP